jgi:hypothetical protein
VTRNLLVALILAVCFQAIPSNGQTETTNAAVGEWNWSFSDKPSTDPSDLVSHGTVTLRADADNTMEWDGSKPPDKGTWEGPMPLAVLLWWDKGDIDMLELSTDGKTLEGKNQAGLKVRGTRQGAGNIDNVLGTWDWAFAKTKYGQPRPCGTVTFQSDDKNKNKMEWNPPLRAMGCGTWNPLRKDPGTFEGPAKRAVLLRWKKGDIDMLELSTDGKTLKGNNKKGMLVKGTKK